MKKSSVSILLLSCLLVLGLDLGCNKTDSPVPPLLKPLFTATYSFTPTVTRTPTSTPTVTLTFTKTNTPTLTETLTETKTATTTDTPTVTNTPTATITQTSTVTSTPTCAGFAGTLVTSGFANATGTSATRLFATEVTVGTSATAWAIEGAFENYIDQDIQFGLYDDSGNLLASSAQGTLPGSGGNFTFTFPIPSTSVSGATSYWVACIIRNTSSSNIGGAVQWPANNGGGYQTTTTWGSMPSSFSPSESGSFSMELLTCP